MCGFLRSAVWNMAAEQRMKFDSETPVSLLPFIAAGLLRLLGAKRCSFVGRLC
jgi:hypothetical protein